MKKCIVEDCKNKVKKNIYCQHHIRRLKKYGIVNYYCKIDGCNNTCEKQGNCEKHIGMKKCCGPCEKILEIKNFDKKGKWYFFLCKDCEPIYTKKYFKTKYYENQEHYKNKSKKYNKEHRNKRKEYREKNKERDKIKRKEKYSKKKEYDKIYLLKNKEIIRKKQNIYQNKKRKNTKDKLRILISSAIRNYLKNKNLKKNRKSILNFLSYTMLELKIHIEKQFEPWMTWENHGIYTKNWNDHDPKTWTWNIDHIVPHSKFNYNSIEDEEFQKCWALENLRPYSAKQNILDGDRR